MALGARAPLNANVRRQGSVPGSTERDALSNVLRRDTIGDAGAPSTKPRFEKNATLTSHVVG